jgi:predicted lysophospholipase L1 biosynthesis ABC-type transport system permease subunit
VCQNEARITSLRKVDWGSMRANFFVMYPVASLADVPATYMAAFRAPDNPGFDNALVRAVSQHHQRGHERHAPRCSACWTR